MCVSIHYWYVNTRSKFIEVSSIFQSCKLPQQKETEQHDDVIKRNAEVSSSVHTYLVFSSAAFATASPVLQTSVAGMKLNEVT